MTASKLISYGPCTFCSIPGHSEDVSNIGITEMPRDNWGTTGFQVASSPSSLSSSTSTNFHWLADTGATSHMTPHCHWIRNYSPIQIPIQLANNSIVYSWWDLWFSTQSLMDRQLKQ